MVKKSYSEYFEGLLSNRLDRLNPWRVGHEGGDEGELNLAGRTTLAG